VGQEGGKLIAIRDIIRKVRCCVFTSLTCLKIIATAFCFVVVTCLGIDFYGCYIASLFIVCFAVLFCLIFCDGVVWLLPANVGVRPEQRES